MSDSVMTYRSKPQYVEAIQWTGNNLKEIRDFGAGVVIIGGCNEKILVLVDEYDASNCVHVPIGCWIVRKLKDSTEYWLCNPDEFAEKFEI